MLSLLQAQAQAERGAKSSVAYFMQLTLHFNVDAHRRRLQPPCSLLWECAVFTCSVDVVEYQSRSRLKDRWIPV